MKSENLIVLGIAAFVGYQLLNKTQETQTQSGIPTIDLSGLLGSSVTPDLSGILGDISGIFKTGIGDISTATGTAIAAIKTAGESAASGLLGGGTGLFSGATDAITSILESAKKEIANLIATAGQGGGTTNSGDGKSAPTLQRATAESSFVDNWIKTTFGEGGMIGSFNRLLGTNTWGDIIYSATPKPIKSFLFQRDITQQSEISKEIQKELTSGGQLTAADINRIHSLPPDKQLAIYEAGSTPTVESPTQSTTKAEKTQNAILSQMMNPSIKPRMNDVKVVGYKPSSHTWD